MVTQAQSSSLARERPRGTPRKITMGTTCSVPERLKFCLLAEGITITEAAAVAIREANGDRAMTPADYASTSGVILQLEDDVWVNAPILEYNPNFVTTSTFKLDRSTDNFVVHGNGIESRARFWLPPLYHGELSPNGEPLNNYVFTHGDRVRLAPITGCAMRCKFSTSHTRIAMRPNRWTLC